MRPRRLAILTVVVALGAAACGAGATARVSDSAQTSTAQATAAQTPTETRRPDGTWTPGPETTIGVPADDGARIIAVEHVAMLQHETWVRVGDPGCPVNSTSSDVGCWIPVGTPEPTTRIVDLTIESPAALQTSCGDGPVSPLRTSKVRLILPRHFAEQPTTRWPVLYLHHGACVNYTFWSQDHDVLTLAAPTDLLIVMPEGDTTGYPRWDTFHLVELRQLLERNWQAGDKRAIAGMSMGGAEAIEEAERIPGMFRFAGSYSGGLDQLNVIDNAAGLRGTALYLSYGNGQLGPLDNGVPSAFDPNGELEASVAHSGAGFVQRLAELGIPVTVHAYGNGTHDPKYWQREFESSFHLILEALGS